MGKVSLLRIVVYFLLLKELFDEAAGRTKCALSRGISGGGPKWSTKAQGIPPRE